VTFLVLCLSERAFMAPRYLEDSTRGVRVCRRIYHQRLVSLCCASKGDYEQGMKKQCATDSEHLSRSSEFKSRPKPQLINMVASCRVGEAETRARSRLQPWRRHSGLRSCLPINPVMTASNTPSSTCHHFSFFPLPPVLIHSLAPLFPLDFPNLLS
jgi:hypothetical protein